MQAPPNYSAKSPKNPKIKAQTDPKTRQSRPPIPPKAIDAFFSTKSPARTKTENRGLPHIVPAKPGSTPLATGERREPSPSTTRGLTPHASDGSPLAKDGGCGAQRHRNDVPEAHATPTHTRRACTAGHWYKA
ncbi:Hypothetical predicted protein [Pelobates cultripes]|uniref:Uncharacterized protein n=1 Tax=Pelobates cultripes TaxID=61616 RepID=A0AAD1W4U3_PELCU|nr:Hypothetical predicted protein [Pelobates cultripes]